MLIIRDKQMEAFRRNLQELYEKRMARRLQVRFPDQTQGWSDEELYDYVRFHTDRARSYGLKRESDLRRYLDFTFVLSPDFDRSEETAWAKVILNARKLDGTEKMSRLNDYYIFEYKGKV